MKKELINVWVDSEVSEFLKENAKKNFCSVSVILRKAIDLYKRRVEWEESQKY